MRKTSVRSVLFLLVLISLGLSGSDCPPSDNSNSNSNNNNNNNNNNSGSGAVTVTLHGILGTEISMSAQVWVGSRAVTRAELADPAALRSAGFADSSLDSDIEPGDLSRQIAAEEGQVVTIIAIESEGIFNPVQFSEAPDPPENVVEFSSFTGANVMTPEPGVATLSPSGENVEVIVNYQRMPQIVLFAWGALSVDFEMDLPQVLAHPAYDNPYDGTIAGGSVIFAPDKFVYRTMQFKSGTEITLTVVTAGDFLRWEGACGGNEKVCTLTFGGSSGTADQVATAVSGYRTCTTNGSTLYSGYTTGNPPGMGCMIVLH